MRITHGLLSGHVLQRTPTGAKVHITGTVAVTGIVTATITAAKPKKGTVVRGWSTKAVGKAAGGAFTATLTGIPTGGPYTVTLAVGSRRVVVQQVFVGDLWLMAGQSNMEGVGNMADAPTPHPLVRNFAMDHHWELARDPLHHLPESPDSVHNGGVQQPQADRAQAKRTRLKGVGVGVYFGVLMHERTGVPQGLIATAHGGTSMDQWDPAKQDQGGASLYYSMLSSMREVAQPVAGMLWYQGCSETNPATVAVYTERMQKLVAAVRKDLGQPKLPWLTVQIGRVVNENNNPLAWNQIQELQRLLPTVIPQLETVTAIDLELDDLIHVSGKAYALLAHRLALAAERLVLGDRRAVPAIQPISAKIIEDQPQGLAIEVRFANVVGGLRSPGLPAGFSLVDRDHKTVNAIYKTTLDSDRAILHLNGDARSGLRVMYGWGCSPTCSVTDARGMGVPVFGPLLPLNTTPLSECCLSWETSAILPGEAIAKLPRPTPAKVGPVTKLVIPGGNFVNCHEKWQGNSGRVAFFGAIDVPETMTAELRAGYDGPIRLWVDGDEVLTDLGGINPAILDAKRIPVTLKKGRRTLTVLMALNDGRAWGFFLRFARLKADPAQIRTGTVPLPVPVKLPAK